MQTLINTESVVCCAISCTSYYIKKKKKLIQRIGVKVSERGFVGLGLDNFPSNSIIYNYK